MKKVGVSEATVSRVSNGKPGVSDSTRQAVLSALDVLGYERPTQLRGERARLVGLVLPELQNPIFPAFAEVIGGALAQLGLTPVLTRTKGGLRGGLCGAAAPTAGLRSAFAGGLYAQADAPHEHYRQLADRNIPVVLVNAAIEHLGFPCVSCDDAVAVEQAWRHLVSLGHERIGLVLGPADHMPSARKLAAARALAPELPDAHIARAMFSIEGGHAAAARLIDRGVTGFICASDPLALGVVRAARRKGLGVPSQVSIVGYDDSALMNCTEPPLTTVRQPIESIGRAAVELLNAQIGGSSVTAEELLFEPELVVRCHRASAPPLRSILLSNDPDSARHLARPCRRCLSVRRQHTAVRQIEVACPRGPSSLLPKGSTDEKYRVPPYLRRTSGIPPRAHRHRLRRQRRRLRGWQDPHHGQLHASEERQGRPLVLRGRHQGVREAEPGHRRRRARRVPLPGPQDVRRQARRRPDGGRLLHVLHRFQARRRHQPGRRHHVVRQGPQELRHHPAATARDIYTVDGGVQIRTGYSMELV